MSESLPLLEFVSNDLFPDVNLEWNHLIGVQHLVWSTCTLVEYCLKHGMKPWDISLLGKCYSTHPWTVQKLKSLGIHVDPRSTEYNYFAPFDDSFTDIISGFSQRYWWDKSIILDDGGKLIANISSNSFSKKIHPATFFIEQTSDGFHYLWRDKTIISFPIINVARSKAKLVHEAPIIAETLIKIFQEKMKQLSLEPEQALIIWNGAIGSALFDLLPFSKKNIFDKKDYSTPEWRINFLDALSHADVIFGATGNLWLHTTILVFSQVKAGCILVSTSSSDREFFSDIIRTGSPFLSSNSPHKDLHISRKLVQGQYVDDDIHVLNSWFPLNFQWWEHSVPPEKIQLTRALLLAAILYGVKNREWLHNWFCEIPIRIQTSIVDKYREIVGDF